MMHAKKGSALLIVLGFLSFMVVSAVAFAIYMRAERVPSSALRRNVAVRHLVEGALAQAMSRVDDAVRGDVFPGLCDTNAQNSCYHDRNGAAYDWWEGRVFMPPDPEGSTMTGTAETRFAPIAETVSVLNLESLGYLPPALVNDVRFLSRSSWAAKWEYFNFDAGRYAFCAVNVSDFFDINRLQDVGPRTSAQPISLAYLFGANQKFTPTSSDLGSFQQLIDTGRPSGSTKGGSVKDVPYVSMLDYNLGFGKLFNAGFGTDARFDSPFWKWISNKSNAQSGYMYMNNNYSSSARELVGAERQTFVTDSWFPADPVTFDLLNNTGKNQKIPDLADTEENSKHYGQPFKMSDLKQAKSGRQIENAAQALPFWQNYTKNGQQKGLLNHLSHTDVLCLWDYLDRDNVPTSLAMPCVERVPMIAGVQTGVDQGQKLLSVKAGKAVDGPGGETMTSTTEYTLESVFQGQEPSVRTLVMYPFKGFDSDSYKVTAYAQLHVGAMPDTARSYLRVNKSATTEKEYLDNGFDQNSAFKDDAFFFGMRGNDTTFSVSAPEREEDMFKESSTRLVLNAPNPSAKAIVQKIDTWRAEKVGEQWMKKEKKSTVYKFLVDPIDTDGNGMKLMGTELSEEDFAAKQFAVSLAVWIRVTNGSGDYVDLMPATYEDDRGNLPSDGLGGSDYYNDEVGGPQNNAPMLRFILTEAFTFKTVTDLADQNPETKVDCVDVAPEDKQLPYAYAACDPRFNWAPEDLIALDKSAVGGRELKDDLWRRKVFHDGGNSWVLKCGQYDSQDCDPFMFVSNQGYLQSVGELAFLPKVSDGNGADLVGQGVNGYNGVARTSADQLVNARCMWQGYPLIQNARGPTPVWEWGVENSSGAFRVNPFTDNETVFMAAIANTPMNYWAAGTNYTAASGASSADTSKKKTMLDSVSEWKKYAVGPDNGFGLNVKYEDLVSLGARMRTELRTAGLARGAWTSAYNALWDGADDGLYYNAGGESETVAKNFLGLTLGNNVYLHGTDRKTLFSFWRDSFANRQQLFLIFVRAESTALGGSGEGTPAQQGGRAVALVWRDPDAPTGQDIHEGVNDSYVAQRHPHRMRVLFYHQFD